MKKIFNKIFDWHVPSALPSRMFPNKGKENEYTWEDWREDMIKKFPIKYHLMETIPNELSYYKSKCNKFLYFLKSVTYKKQHLLDLRQPKNICYQFEYRYGYSDVRQKFIYANLNLLCEFVKEHGGIRKLQEYTKNLRNNNEENHNENWIKFYDVVIETYDWWKFQLPLKIKELEEISIDKYLDKENEIEKEINDKIKLMIDYREYFWV
jgi:hypothetical protein